MTRGSRSSSSPSSRPATPRVREVDRLAYRVPREAARALGLSPDAFDAHVRPDVKVTRIGRIVLVARAELQAWLDRTGGRIRDEVTA